MPTSAGIPPFGQTVILNKAGLQIIIDRLWQEEQAQIAAAQTAAE